MSNLGGGHEVEVTKAGARVLFRVKFMLFEKAAHRSYNLMPGSIDKEHTEMIWIVPTVHTRAFCPAAAQGQLPAFCFKASDSCDVWSSWPSPFQP